MRILALDVGDKKIGLAVGDTAAGMAFARPALLVNSWDEIWAPLAALLKQESIEKIVVGWPLNDDGSPGPQTARVTEFMQTLLKHTTVPLLKRDERHTSQAVQREHRQAGHQLARGEEDSLAAQLLAEAYLQESA